MPNIEDIRRLCSSQEEKWMIRWKEVVEEMAEYKRSVEQQREQEQREYNEKFQRLENMLQQLYFINKLYLFK